METIKTKERDLDHIVSQLLLFSKMELGEYPKDLRKLRLNEVMEDIVLARQEKDFYLSFADDGPGVSKEALPHPFEVFYRRDLSRQNPHQGSGLGLAIVAATAEQMGESKPGTVPKAFRAAKGAV